jgi:hypothetical protein
VEGAETPHPPDDEATAEAIVMTDPVVGRSGAELVRVYAVGEDEATILWEP